ncbi:glycosyltransferase [Natrinema halophilum]|uniref:Glycosyltransferase n=1 Tax=Natrinema halophilum TaxID=1699371 RepID=A0A7D5GJ00_9EURY|nr:glycosyltransferase family 2 protein [Natrinema halophilum]QLG47950.1 glycosyltransferase family 2 protein [Natrinema halophilum]
MSGYPPTSVILPTVEWADACAEVLDQLEPGDELLIICDNRSDPVYDRRDDLPVTARVIAAGEPEGCSGKANAIATGMEAAGNDRIIWTDDDFHHPPDWLTTLNADYERHGPTSELPVFIGNDPLSYLVEPLYAYTGTGMVYAADVAWGGALVFERDDVNGKALLRDLRRTVSDDGTLAEYVDFTAVKRTRRVEIGGTIRESLERHVRFTKLVRHHDRDAMIAAAVVGTLVSVAYLLYPLAGLVLSTLCYGAVYAAFGIRRWTVLLSYPATIAQVPLLAYALARRTFVWGGRRYRWRSMFDVEVLE